MGTVTDHPSSAARLQHALELAYRFIELRDRTALELRRHLEARRVEPATIEQALVTLGQQGFIDDAAFARRLVEDKRTLEHWGTERITRRLLARGVPPALADAALGPADAESELAAARALIERRFPRLTDDPRERRRALGLLIRRGYEAELAGDAVRAHIRGD